MAILDHYGVIGVHIRKARPADWEACLALDHTNVTEHALRMQERERDESIAITFQTVRLPRPLKTRYPRQDQALTAGWERCDLFLVAQSNRETCGYVTAQALAGHGIAWIQDLVVAPEWRRRKLGTDLLRRATDWALQKRLRRLVIEVQTSNHPGICFCRSQGLTFCGFNDQHWPTQDIAVLYGQNLR